MRPAQGSPENAEGRAVMARPSIRTALCPTRDASDQHLPATADVLLLAPVSSVNVTSTLREPLQPVETNRPLVPLPIFLIVEETEVMPESRPVTGCSRFCGTEKVSAPPVASVLSLASIAWLIEVRQGGRCVCSQSARLLGPPA